MKNSSLALYLLPVASLLSGLANAQSTTPSSAADQSGDSAGTLDKITVTASKRTQVLLDVPYAVTPISGAEIRDRGILDIQDLQQAVPSLSISQNAPGQSRIQLRGIGSLVGLPTVGVYLDELPLDFGSVQHSLDIPLVDMQRIEVLRGPQGTLYGSSSLGGTIRFLTQAPNLNTLEVKGESGFRKISGAGGLGYNANAVVNVPIVTNTFGVRLVAGVEDIPGWIDNPRTGQTDINTQRRDYFRAKALWRVSDRVDVTLLAYQSHLHQNNDSYSDENGRFDFKVATPSTDRASLYNLVVNADLGPVSLVSSTGYSDRHLDNTYDFSTSVPVPGGASYRDRGEIRTFSQELRANSNGTGPISWTAGLYYRTQDTPATATIPAINYVSSGTEPVNSEQYAVFGEGTYAFTSAWSASLGVRYFIDRQTREQTSGVPVSATQKFHATSPRVSTLWRYAPDASVYATVSKGFRSGGFNQFYDTPLTYGPETLWSYELGTRASAWANRLQYDVSVYYSQYRNIQGYQISALPFVHAITQNTGRASGPGVDASASLLLVKDLTLDLSASYVDIKYDITNLDRLEGDPLNYVPKKTASAGLTYRFPWFQTGLPGMARVDYLFASPYQVIARNQNPQVYSSQANRSLNARLGVEMKHWQVYLEGRNLTNNYAILYPKLGAQVGDERQIPRSVGVTARAEF